MANRNFVIITDDIYNELEDLLTGAFAGDPDGLAAIRDYVFALENAATTLDTVDDTEEILEALGPALDWVRRSGIPAEDEEDSIFYAIESSTQFLGELMIPLSGNGYDPSAELGRLSADQIPDYDPTLPQLSFAGVFYSFVDPILDPNEGNNHG